MQHLVRAGQMPTLVLGQPAATGNQTVQRLLQSPAIHRQPNPRANAPSAWATTRAAIHSARAAKRDAEADKLTREAIATVAARAIFPPGITKIAPTPDDIRLDSKISASAHAQTRPKDIPTDPTNYWRWLYFTPGLIDGSETQIESIVTHELVHVAQFMKVWDLYTKDTSPTKPAWDDYLKPYQQRARVEGPEELEAHVTSLNFLKRLAPDEQQSALRGLFSSFISTAAYIPPAGESLAISTADVGPRILTCFSAADATLQDRMGQQLWWSLMDVGPAKSTWIAVLRDLKPVALKGYANPTLRPIYDDLLRAEGIKPGDWRS